MFTWSSGRVRGKGAPDGGAVRSGNRDVAPIPFPRQLRVMTRDVSSRTLR